MKLIQRVDIVVKEGKVSKTKAGEPKKVVDSVAEMLLDKTGNFTDSIGELAEYYVDHGKKVILTHRHSGWEEVKEPKKQNSKDSK